MLTARLQDHSASQEASPMWCESSKHTTSASLGTYGARKGERQATSWVNAHVFAAMALLVFSIWRRSD
eukprot:6193797-Pleurochrysis_carterae.AAC.1